MASATAQYPKALLRLVPFVGGGDELPSDTLSREDVELDRGHLTDYQKVCGFRVSDRLPATYPHMIAFPLSMELMTRLSFPFGVIGLVHIGNRIELSRPIYADERLDVRVRTEKLRDHDKGTQFDVVAEADAGGEQVWHSTSTYLHREGGDGSSSKSDKKSEPPESNVVWSVPGDQGRRYAGVSGDANPIHLHPLTARLFGFPKPIAHGMWVKARCLAALEAQLPDAYTVDVRFKLPMLLPAKAAFTTTVEDGKRVFSVSDARSGKPHVSGEIVV